MFKTIAIAAAVAVSLSAYAAHSRASANQNVEAFSATSGQCKLVAETADSGGGFVVASGRPQFVTDGAAARQQSIYTACMEANGY